MSQHLLSIDQLFVEFSTRNGTVEVLRGISLSLNQGETLGIVGESGSGKSVTSYAATRLLDRAGKVTRGSVDFMGRDLLGIPERQMARIRGVEISMIFQNPRAALNPIRTVERQIADVLSAHTDLDKRGIAQRTVELLQDVRLSDVDRVRAAYPHELSGGMCQRIMIALAIACSPKLLIADEPTTGLDVTTQKAVMDLLSGVAAKRGMGLILITHDLGLASRYCNRICVMQNGAVVEQGLTAEVFEHPKHPYTQRLIAASPTATSTIDDLLVEKRPARKPTSRISQLAASTPLLRVKNLTKRFGQFAAVDDVSFDLFPGESLGLVGESGSGKSTTSRLICRLLDKTSGTIEYEGKDIGNVGAAQFHAHPERRDIQIVFQDPHDSLNPRYTAFDCIAHPLRGLLKLRDPGQVRQRVVECAERVGLPLDLLSRYPHQLSGGQKARVGIARAIATQPKLLILDEPTAALDVSVQAIVLELLDRLRAEDGLAFLFVSHDLNVVRMLCDRIVVLKSGRIMEQATSATLFANPQSDYTRALLDASPSFEGGKRSESACQYHEPNPPAMQYAAS